MKKRFITVLLLGLLLALLFGISRAGASTMEEIVKAVLNGDSTAGITPPENPQGKRSGTRIPITKGRLLHYADDQSQTPDYVETFPISDTYVWLFDDVTAICETGNGNFVWNGSTVDLGSSGGYTLSGQQSDISTLAGHKVFLLMRDGDIHTFVCSGVSGNTLTVGGDSYTNHIACYIQDAAADSSGSGNGSWSKHIDHMVIPLADNLGSIELDGDIEVELSGGTDWDWSTVTWTVGIDPFKFTMDLDSLTVTLKAAMEVEKDIGHFAVEIVPGVFQIDFTPAVFVEAEAEGELTYAVRITEGFTLGFEYCILDLIPSGISFNRISEGPDAEFENFTVKGTIYTGLTWGPGIEFLEIFKLAIRYRGGIVIDGQMQAGPWDDGNHYRWHACEDFQCIQGSVFPRIGPITVDLVLGGVVSQNLLSIPAGKDFDPLFEFYYSWTFGDGSWESMCPHYGYRVNTTVVGSDGAKLTDATVSYPLAEEDRERFGQWADDVGMDSSGVWLVYVPRSSPSSKTGGDGNKVTLTAKIKDPLDPAVYLSGTAEITEKGQSSKDDPPDPESATITIDNRVVTIRFLDSGSGAANLPAPVQFHPFISQGAYLPDTIPVKGGNTFVCWSTEKDGSGKHYTPGAYVETDTDMDLYAQFRIISNQYVVAYNANGGASAPEPQLGIIGRPITLTRESAVGKDGMAFLGWSLTQDGAVDYKPGDTFTCPEGEKVVVLYAVWAFEPLKVVKIHYDLNGGTIETPIPDRWVRKAASVQITEDIPEKMGNVFLGWALTPGAAEADYLPGKSYHFTKDTTLYAVFQPESPLGPYTVTFDLNGGPQQDVPAPITIKPARWFRIPDIRLSWDQFHRFEGWSTNPNAKKAEYFPGRLANFTGDTTLYAVWIPYYKVTFDPNGGETDGNSGKVTMIVRRGTIITIPKAPFRYKYQFLYWRGSRYNPGDRYAVWEDHTFTAEWKKKPPKTGDSAPLLLWGGLMILGILGVGGLAVSRRRRKMNQ